ncbi:MAG: hypothetical protein ACJZ12_04605 [Candidatus Neomarinimicrobiota bacterium]
MFQEMANKGHYRKVGGSRQGIYICSPKGTLLASVNSLNPDVVLETIEAGLIKWNKLPASEQNLPENFTPSITHRWEDSYPDKGLVLKGAKADLLTDPPQFSDRGDRWNMDFIWFNNSESNLWLPKKYEVGQTHECPRIIKDRLFRFHLVDNVRGQTLPFAPEEIKKANLNVKLIDIDSSNLQLKIFGNSVAVAKGKWKLGKNDWTPTHDLNHSISTNILGKAIYNIDKNQFTKFEMVIIGNWRGKAGVNGRGFGLDTGQIGMLYNLASTSSADKIAPAFIDLYNADWINQPN